MSTLCKDGDIAIITKEEFGCERNIGKCVLVIGPCVVNPELGLCWSITPIHEGLWAYLSLDSNQVVLDIEIQPGEIIHPDSWMFSINRFDSSHEAVACAENVHGCSLNPINNTIDTDL